MTEAEWLACRDLKAMLAWLGDRVSGRKRRLFACACCRTEWGRIDEEDGRKAIAAAERYADGLIRDSTVTSWFQRAARARNRVRGDNRGMRELYQGVVEAALPDELLDRVAAAYQYVSTAVAYFRAGPGHREPAWQAAREEAIASFVPLLRDVVGNPFHEPAFEPSWLAWNDGTIRKVAQAAYDEGTFDRLPILADALEEAGCTDAALLSHLRGPGPHVRGCWAVDLVMGKA